jgi:putative membrane protein
VIPLIAPKPTNGREKSRETHQNVDLGASSLLGVGFLLRAAVTGFALWIVTLIVPGMEFVGGQTSLHKVGIIFVVGIIFGLVNAVIKPLVTLFSLPLYVLTLGLFHVVVNALMLWITAWITDHTTHWGLHIDRFWWTAIWAAILLSIVGWVLSLGGRSAQRALSG